MCFYVEDPKKYIAEEDIICYKIVCYNENPFYVRSYWKSFKYKFNILYQTNIVQDPNCKMKLDLETEVGIINNGFHSYQRIPDHIYGIIVRCTIPEGSEYYRNNGHNEYVSNQIIINEIINDTEIIT